MLKVLTNWIPTTGINDKLVVMNYLGILTLLSGAQYSWYLPHGVLTFLTSNFMSTLTDWPVREKQSWGWSEWFSGVLTSWQKRPISLSLGSQTVKCEARDDRRHASFMRMPLWNRRRGTMESESWKSCGQHSVTPK